jgi:tRNA (cytosine38-C5)-methyltransferase
MKRKIDVLTQDSTSAGSSEFTALEFFSGIGGWSCGFKAAGLDFQILQAFDINTAANEIYFANHGLKPSAKSILTLSASYIDKLKAKVWLMSPPCQPFTRSNQTASRDVKDARSEPFLHLIELLPQLTNPPLYIALENVVGFESSECCSRFLDVLENLQYSFHQFHLDPLSLGIPNSRPRYYCIARKNEGITHQLPSSREIGSEAMLASRTNFSSGVPNKVGFYLQDDLSAAQMVSLLNFFFLL